MSKNRREKLHAVQQRRKHNQENLLLEKIDLDRINRKYGKILRKYTKDKSAKELAALYRDTEFLRYLELQICALEEGKSLDAELWGSKADEKAMQICPPVKEVVNSGGDRPMVETLVQILNIGNPEQLKELDKILK